MTSTTTTTTLELKDCDVVCGRGGLANKHPGNRMLRRICNENRTLYQSSMNPTHKQCLILSILMAIQQHNGKFVARNRNGWEEISDKKAREKVAQLLRESNSNTSEAPISIAGVKQMAIRDTKPVITTDTSSSNRMMQTPIAPPARQPIIVPSAEPLPIRHHHQHIITPDTIPSNDGADLIIPKQEESLPMPLAPAAPAAPAASPRAFDDGDLFDLIPLEAADTYGSEFQDMCHGLVSVFATAC